MSTQTLQEQETIARQWYESRCPKEWIHHEGGMKMEFVATLQDMVDEYFGGVVTLDNLDSAANYVKIKLQKPEITPPPPDPKEERDRAVAIRWLKERCPKHLLDGKGGIGREFAAKMAGYLREHYQNQWTLDNLDKAAKYLQLRNELPEKVKQSVDHSSETVARKLLDIGVQPTGLINHARKESDKPGTSFKEFLNKLVDGAKRASEIKPQYAEEKGLRRIPDGETNFKKYTAAEIRQYLKRKQSK
jgi:hypothetical protein